MLLYLLIVTLLRKLRLKLLFRWLKIRVIHFLWLFLFLFYYLSFINLMKKTCLNLPWLKPNYLLLLVLWLWLIVIILVISIQVTVNNIIGLWPLSPQLDYFNLFIIIFLFIGLLLWFLSFYLMYQEVDSCRLGTNWISEYILWCTNLRILSFFVVLIIDGLLAINVITVAHQLFQNKYIKYLLNKIQKKGFAIIDCRNHFFLLLIILDSIASYDFNN